MHNICSWHWTCEIPKGVINTDLEEKWCGHFPQALLTPRFQTRQWNELSVIYKRFDQFHPKLFKIDLSSGAHRSKGSFACAHFSLSLSGTSPNAVESIKLFITVPIIGSYFYLGLFQLTVPIYCNQSLHH